MSVEHPKPIPQDSERLQSLVVDALYSLAICSYKASACEEWWAKILTHKVVMIDLGNADSWQIQGC